LKTIFQVTFLAAFLAKILKGVLVSRITMFFAESKMIDGKEENQLDATITIY
jgi:hypothetical protein